MLHRDDAIEFEPRHFQQMAGLVCYYNSAKFHYLYMSRDETAGKHLRVMSALPDSVDARRLHAADCPFPTAPRRSCASTSTTSDCGSRYRFDGERVALAAAAASTRASCRTRRPRPGLPNFTGAFVGMACQDLAGAALPADFDYFEYVEREFMSEVRT